VSNGKSLIKLHNSFNLDSKELSLKDIFEQHNWSKSYCYVLRKVTISKHLHMIPNSYTRFSKRLHDSNFNHLTRKNVFVYVIDYIIAENVKRLHTITHNSTYFHTILYFSTQLHMIPHNSTHFHTIPRTSHNYTCFHTIPHNSTHSYTISQIFTQLRIIPHNYT